MSADFWKGWNKLTLWLWTWNCVTQAAMSIKHTWPQFRGSSISLHYVHWFKFFQRLNSSGGTRHASTVHSFVSDLFWGGRNCDPQTAEHPENRCEASNLPVSLWVLWYRLVQSFQEGPDEQRKGGMKRKERGGERKKGRLDKTKVYTDRAQSPLVVDPGGGAAWPREHTMGFVVRSVTHTN